MRLLVLLLLVLSCGGEPRSTVAFFRPAPSAPTCTGDGCPIMAACARACAHLEACGHSQNDCTSACVASYGAGGDDCADEVDRWVDCGEAEGGCFQAECENELAAIRLRVCSPENAPANS